MYFKLIDYFLFLLPHFYLSGDGRERSSRSSLCAGQRRRLGPFKLASAKPPGFVLLLCTAACFVGHFAFPLGQLPGKTGKRQSRFIGDDLQAD